MIIGIGTDIIEIDRIRRAVERNHFRNRVFTSIEQNYCESRNINKAASYAARFAGKEAFFKALGTGIVTDLTDIEIVNDSRGQPHVVLHDQAARLVESDAKIHLSLSHSKNYATAVCMIELETR